jgi:hypothetical protein
VVKPVAAGLIVTVNDTPAPNGRGRWTLRLLADKLVELEIADGISREAVRQTLKKRPEAMAAGAACLPEEPSGEFVYHMEDVLDVYIRPYDPRRPQVCLDETSVQLIGEKRIPVSMAPGRPAVVHHDNRHGE